MAEKGVDGVGEIGPRVKEEAHGCSLRDGRERDSEIRKNETGAEAHDRPIPISMLPQRVKICVLVRWKISK
jgi:hypothetical protein